MVSVRNMSRETEIYRTLLDGIRYKKYGIDLRISVLEIGDSSMTLAGLNTGNNCLSGG
jgi:hypothetical protein